MEIAKQLDRIKEDPDFDLDFVEALSGNPLHVSTKLKVRIDQIRKRLGQDFFPKVIWTITQKSYSTSEARSEIF